VTLKSITIFQKRSWLFYPQIYFRCADGNQTELSFVKQVMHYYPLVGNETWQVCVLTWHVRLLTWEVCKQTWEVCKQTWQMCKQTWQMCKQTWQMCKQTWKVELSVLSSVAFSFLVW